MTYVALAPSSTKVCTKCGVEKPFSEFHKRTLSKDGLMAQCKECVNARVRANYHADPEPKKAKTRQYHLDNPDWSKQKLRESHVRNRDARYQRVKERLASDPDFRAYKNKLTARSEHQRRAQKAGTSVGKIPLSEYEKVLDEYNGSCWICGTKLEKVFWDHYHPLSKGGPHELENLRPCCNECNSRKNAIWPFTDEMKNMIAEEVRALRTSQSVAHSVTDGLEVMAHVNGDD